MEPDADAVFAAEADINHRGMRTRIARARSAGHDGEIDVLAARGGIDPGLIDKIGEQEPLLGDRNTDGNGGSGSGGAEWPGSKDFDHLPWYKKPSVCPHSPFLTVGITAKHITSRSTGCWYHSFACRSLMEV